MGMLKDTEWCRGVNFMLYKFDLNFFFILKKEGKDEGV